MVNVCYFSYPSNAVCLVSVVLQPHACTLGFSQRCLILESLLVVLVRESEVRNDLCCHLGVVTLSSSLFLSCKIGFRYKYVLIFGIFSLCTFSSTFYTFSIGTMTSC